MKRIKLSVCLFILAWATFWIVALRVVVHFLSKWW